MDLEGQPGGEKYSPKDFFVFFPIETGMNVRYVLLDELGRLSWTHLV